MPYNRLAKADLLPTLQTPVRNNYLSLLAAFQIYLSYLINSKRIQKLCCSNVLFGKASLVSKKDIDTCVRNQHLAKGCSHPLFGLYTQYTKCYIKDTNQRR